MDEYLKVSSFLSITYGVKCPKCGEIHFSDTKEWQIIKCDKCETTFQAIPKD